MQLTELAFACYIYAHMSDYDSSYGSFKSATRPQLDLSLAQHRMALLKWLNAWGCRQFAKDYHQLAASELAQWYEEGCNLLCPTSATLLSLADADFTLVIQAYAGLVGRTASVRQLSTGRNSRVEFGPSGTAKILFAMRPDALVPWDDSIREAHGLDGSPRSYAIYLSIVKDHLETLRRNCERRGFSLMDLPQLVGRPESSVAKLVDEYFWVTISRECVVPAGSEFARWVQWL